MTFASFTAVSPSCTSSLLLLNIIVLSQLHLIHIIIIFCFFSLIESIGAGFSGNISCASCFLPSGSVASVEPSSN